MKCDVMTMMMMMMMMLMFYERAIQYRLYSARQIKISTTPVGPYTSLVCRGERNDDGDDGDDDDDCQRQSQKSAGHMIVNVSRMIVNVSR